MACLGGRVSEPDLLGLPQATELCRAGGRRFTKAPYWAATATHRHLLGTCCVPDPGLGPVARVGAWSSGWVHGAWGGCTGLGWVHGLGVGAWSSGWVHGLRVGAWVWGGCTVLPRAQLHAVCIHASFLRGN